MIELLERAEQVRDAPGKPIKLPHRQATLQHLHQWTQRLTWLESILPTRPFLTEIAHTKIQPFAAEASALEVGDMRDIHNRSRRHSLLICFLYHAQVQTRDQLVEMLLGVWEQWNRKPA